MIKLTPRAVFLYSIVLMAVLMSLIYFIIQKGIVIKAPEEVPQSSSILAGEKQFLGAIYKKQESCQAIKNRYYQNLCYYSFTLREAVTKRDVTLCNHLVGDFIKTCQNNYYFQIARKEKDLSLCSKISYLNLKSQCMHDVTKLISPSQTKVGNPGSAICTGAKRKETKKVCQNLALLKDFPTKNKCNSFQDIASKKICLAIVAKQEQIKGLPIQKIERVVCSEIKESDIKQICFDFFTQLSNHVTNSQQNK